MGNCDGRPLLPPVLDNVCSTQPISTTLPDPNVIQVANTCTTWGGAGAAARAEICAAVGGYSGEWELYPDNGTTITLPNPLSNDYTTTGPHACAYNSCNGKQDFAGLGCCDGCCGISGIKTFCRRKAYLADPTNCCFLDSAFTGDSTGCFAAPSTSTTGFAADSTRRTTCDPSVRDITNSNCAARAEAYCSGTDLSTTDIAWMDRWLTGNKECIYFINRSLYNLPPGNVAPVTIGKGMDFIDADLLPPSVIKPQGNVTVRRIIAAAIDKYRRQGYQLGARPGSQAYHPLQEVFLNICTTQPGLCQDGLYNACAGLTAQQLATRPDLIKWCGCYLPDVEYARYTDQFQLTVECTPLCSRPEAIKLSTENGLSEKTCQQDACIIDGVTIALANTTVEGQLRFGQVCGGCTGNCRCMLSNTTLAIANSTIGGNIDLTQGCSGAVQCFQDDSDGIPQQVPCSDDDAAGQLAQQQRDAALALQRRRTLNLWLWIGGAIAVAAIAFLVYLIASRRRAIKPSPSYNSVPAATAVPRTTAAPAATLVATQVAPAPAASMTTPLAPAATVTTSLVPPALVVSSGIAPPAVISRTLPPPAR